MKTEHTPAPWTIQHGETRRVYLINDRAGHAIGEIVYTDTRNPSDAQLIAAAPDLLAALQWALRQIEDDLDPDHQAALEQAHAAIYKAIGA
jgi:hypothetical protein